MKINQRNEQELADALLKVEEALKIQLANTGGQLRKITVLSVLAGRGWCSPASSGIEKSFLSALKAKNIALTPLFAKLMDEPCTSPITQEVQSHPAPEPAMPLTRSMQATSTDFTVLNLKAVSLAQSKDGKTEIRFVGSTDGLAGSVAVSLFRSSCNLIEFAI